MASLRTRRRRPAHLASELSALTACGNVSWMIGALLALGLGVAAFPLISIFGPVHFPWSLLVLACLGVILGLSIVDHSARTPALRAIGLAALMVVVTLSVRRLTGNIVLSLDVMIALLASSPWLLLPTLPGVLIGAHLRARAGFARGAVIGAATAVVIALIGTGLAFIAAPPDVANAPACDRGFECPRTLCAYMAERRRVLAIERVTAFDGERITCTYTAWGGIYIGQASTGRGGGRWTDGVWPLIVSGRD